MKLSIITVCLNNLDGLKRTFESVVSQTARREFEWIVVDGASTDGTPYWLQEHDTQIDRWVSEPDSGIFNAMNKGVTLSRAEYLLFLNSGDYLASNDIIEKCIPELDGTDLIYSDQKVQLPGCKETELWDYPSHITPVHFLEHTLPHQACLIKESIQRVDPYTEKYQLMGDYLFFAKQIILKGATSKKIATPISVFMLDGVSMRDWNKMMQERYKSFADTFSPTLIENLRQLEALQSLPALSINIAVLRFRHFIGKWRRKLFGEK